MLSPDPEIPYLLTAGSWKGVPEKASLHPRYCCPVRSRMLGQTDKCTGAHTVQVCSRDVIWATLHNAARQWTLFIRAKFSGEPAGLNIALSWPEVSVTIKLNSEAQVMFFQVSRNNSNLIQSTEEWFIGYLFSLPGSFFPLGVQNEY